MFTLPDETQEIRDLARDFARNEIIPGAGERDRSHRFPAELVATQAARALRLAEVGRGLGLLHASKEL